MSFYRSFAYPRRGSKSFWLFKRYRRLINGDISDFMCNANYHNMYIGHK